MNKYYVYLHCKATTGEVFYVGKGCDQRAYEKHNRSWWWNRIVESNGYYIDLCDIDLTESEAFKIERELIEEYGRKDCGEGGLVNQTDGGDGAPRLSPEAAARKSAKLKGKVRTPEMKLRYAKSKTGKKNPNYDPTKYEWIRKSGEKRYCTINELTREFGLRNGALSEVRRGNKRQAGGWHHKEYRETIKHGGHTKGRDHGGFNPALYKWVKANGDIRLSTLFDMGGLYGIPSSRFSSVKSGNKKSCRGWFFETVKKTNMNQNNKVYK